MTDLERARLTYGVIRDFGWDVLWKSSNPIPDDAWPIDIIANAIAAARREGAEKADDAWAAGRRQGLLEGAGPTASWQLTQEYERGAEEMRERAGRRKPTKPQCSWPVPASNSALSVKSRQI